VVCHWKGDTLRPSENAHLPFGTLTALSKVDPSTSLKVDAEPCRSIEGLRYPHPSSLRRTSMSASFLGISQALDLDMLHQPPTSLLFDSLVRTPGYSPRILECEYHHRCP
jgi:hypothetical protein